MGVSGLGARRAWSGIALLAACGGAKTAPKDATLAASAPADAKVADGRGGSDAAPAKPAPPTTGDARVRVEWPDVPIAARASAGKTACGTPRAPSVHPTTTWGVPDAIVVLDGEPATGEARIELAPGGCALAPIVALGGSLALVSADAKPAKLALARAPAIDRPVAADVQTAMLPIAGHTVTSPIEPGAAVRVDAGGELAWVVGGRGAITDASGTALVRDLAPGSHTITAWLPPRAGQPGRLAHGRVVIAIGDVADLTLTLAAAP